MLLRALTAAVGAAVSVSGVAIEAGARKALWSDGQNNAWCSELWEEAPKMLEDLEVYIADDYPGKCGTTLMPGDAAIAYPDPVPISVAFCRFGAWVHTSNSSRVQFEVFLPDEWNGRMTMMGNGGNTGGVNRPDMGVSMNKYGFAVASTDTGHHGSGVDGTFAINGSESLTDFGYRAVHLTTVYSQKIIEAYYGRKDFKRYWFGCSSGGKQGLKEAEFFPEDYDGILAGAAAQDWSRLMGQMYYVTALVNTPDSARFIDSDHFKTVNEFVLQSCDAEDGVVGGIITNPWRCQPNLSMLNCDQPFANQSACLTTEQVQTMYMIWADWTATNGTWLYSGFTVGAEGLDGWSPSGPTFQAAPDYFNYQVLNNTEVGPFTANITELERLLNLALETNPGQINADKPDIRDFLKHGKLMTYVGLADTLIPAGGSIHYWHEVQRALGYPDDFGDSYRMFAIPAAGHCGYGPGAWNVGVAAQFDITKGGGGQDAQHDAEHDMVLALIDWVEKDKAPDHLIGAHYIGDDKRNGVEFTRKLCPWPQEAVYMGGDASSAKSFECRYVA